MSALQRDSDLRAQEADLRITAARHYKRAADLYGQRQDLYTRGRHDEAEALDEQIRRAEDTAVEAEAEAYELTPMIARLSNADALIRVVS